MSTFYQNYLNICSQLKLNYTETDWEELYISFKDFVKNNLQTPYINPDYFALKYDIDIHLSRDLFIAFSKNSYGLKLYYQLECDNCSEKIIVSDPKQLIHCPNCSKEYNYNEINSIVERTEFSFRIEPSFKQELISRLKDLPSSSAKKSSNEYSIKTHDEVEGSLVRTSILSPEEIARKDIRKAIDIALSVKKN